MNEHVTIQPVLKIISELFIEANACVGRKLTCAGVFL